MVKVFEVLELSVHLLKRSLRLVQCVALLSDLDRDSGELVVLLLAGLGQDLDSSLYLVELSLELLCSELVATDIQITSVYLLRSTMDVAIVLV